MAWFGKSSKIAPKDDTSMKSIHSALSHHVGTETPDSMTPSQLDAAILEMLNVTPTTLQSACAGNPITKSGKRKQMAKMIIFTMFPNVVLMGITAAIFGERIAAYTGIINLQQAISECTTMGAFVRQLQNERDTSALYHSSIGPETKRALILQYPKTDEALENITNWPMHMMSSQKHYQSKERFSLFLKAHRYGLEDEQQRVLRELDFYTSHLELFVRWMYNLASEEVASGSVWKRLVAYLSIVQAKSELGIERSIGAIFYARGGFETRETYLRFLEAQDNAQSMLGGANLYADMVQEMYNKTYLRNKTMTNMIADMREDIRERAFTGRNRSATLALYWYDNLTFQIDIMLDIQKVVADTMLVTLRERAHAERLELVGEGVAFMIALLLCPMITKAIYMITSQMQGISMMLSAKTRELNKEKKRTDTLLYQMLPKTIAESLKRNEDVVAELYQDTTIFFSDIVGFTDISSRASPFQVIQMLNSLYTAFDRKIEKYDVFKVETIGDAYMVASGLPCRNGTRHSYEIAIMSLDLLDHISQLEIPHMPDEKFRLRIGVHTGPVAAGVVGLKMPRYCVLGETVSIASRMESLGLPNRIHISITTFDALSNLGGFHMTRRHKLVKQSEHLVSSAGKGETTTYWLLGSDHFKTPGGVSTPKYDSSDVEGPSCSKYGESEEVPQNAFIERRGSITYQEDE